MLGVATKLSHSPLDQDTESEEPPTLDGWCLARYRNWNNDDPVDVLDLWILHGLLHSE